MNSELASFASALDVSRETLGLFQKYADLLVRWNRRINLVSAATEQNLWTRHFLDSAQLIRLVEPNGHWVDLGSGAGFPGLVVAALCKSKSNVRFTLIESDQRKATFLRAVARELNLRVRVIADRVEALPPQNADILSARALASLDTLLLYSDRHRKPEGVAVFPKGENVQAEIDEALERWRFDCKKHPSLTDPGATILCIGEIARV